jgi:hypothetical protein
MSPFETARRLLSEALLVDTERASSRSPEVPVVLYRFAFAPVLLAIAVLTTSPRRVTHPHPAAAPPGEATAAQIAPLPASHAPARAARAVSSHPATVR